MEKFGDVFQWQQQLGEGSFFGFPLVLKRGTRQDRADLVSCLADNGIEARPIVAGNFLNQPVVKYFDYSVHGDLDNAEKIHDLGIFVGNHHYPLTKELAHFGEVLGAWKKAELDNLAIRGKRMAEAVEKRLNISQEERLREEMMTPRLSIVTITYNNYEELVATLQSIKGADMPLHEQIVINGGECPLTNNYLKAKQIKHIPNRITEFRCFQQGNKTRIWGLHNSRIQPISASHGAL